MPCTCLSIRISPFVEPRFPWTRFPSPHGTQTAPRDSMWRRGGG